MPSATDAAVDVNYANYRLGNEVLPGPQATFVRNGSVPDIYEANHVSDIRARTPDEIDALLEAIEREYQNCHHRRFDVDHRTPPEFVARLLVEGGYERSDAVVMLLAGELLGQPRPTDIRPIATDVDWRAYWDLMWLNWKEHRDKEGRPSDEGVARQMLDAHRRKQPPVQYFMAYLEGRPAAYFNSWEGLDGVGQVEDLFTHPEFRNQGIARSLIHHCVSEARASGARQVVIVADPADSPKKLYERMGFLPVAWTSYYLKRLSDEPARSA